MPRYENIVSAASEAFKRLNPDLFPPAAESVGTEDESKLHDEIYAFLRQLGVHAIVHSRMDRATTNAIGTADFLFVWGRNAYAIEAKSKTGKLSTEQLGFLFAAKMDGWITGVVRSLDDLKKIVNP